MPTIRCCKFALKDPKRWTSISRSEYFSPKQAANAQDIAARVALMFWKGQILKTLGRDYCMFQSQCRFSVGRTNDCWDWVQIKIWCTTVGNNVEMCWKCESIWCRWTCLEMVTTNSKTQTWWRWWKGLWCCLSYTQFVTLCGQNGHVDKVLEVRNEWSQSTIGRKDNTLHSEVFCGGVISALAMNGRADDAEKVFSTRSLADKTEIMPLSLLTTFSQAGLHKGNFIAQSCWTRTSFVSSSVQCSNWCVCTCW